MPNCYRLTAKENVPALPAGNAGFIELDERICAHFGATPHDIDWYEGWENAIGIPLATGQTFDQITETLLTFSSTPTRLCEVVQYIADNYTARCWYQAGR